MSHASEQARKRGQRRKALDYPAAAYWKKSASNWCSLSGRLWQRVTAPKSKDLKEGIGNEKRGGGGYVRPV